VRIESQFLKNFLKEEYKKKVQQSYILVPFRIILTSYLNTNFCKTTLKPLQAVSNYRLLVNWSVNVNKTSFKSSTKTKINKQIFHTKNIKAKSSVYFSPFKKEVLFEEQLLKSFLEKNFKNVETLHLKKIKAPLKAYQFMFFQPVAKKQVSNLFKFSKENTKLNRTNIKSSSSQIHLSPITAISTFEKVNQTTLLGKRKQKPTLKLDTEYLTFKKGFKLKVFINPNTTLVVKKLNTKFLYSIDIRIITTSLLTAKLVRNLPQLLHNLIQLGYNPTWNQISLNNKLEKKLRGWHHDIKKAYKCSEKKSFISNKGNFNFFI